MHFTRNLVAFLFCLTLLGCHLGPKYRPPVVETPEQWKSKTTEPSSAEPAPPQEACQPTYVNFWWEVFRDEQLNFLEQTAIANNQNLVQSIERVIQARAHAGEEKASLYPKVTLNPLFTDTGQLFQLNLPPGFDVPGVNAGRTIFRVHQFQYSLPLNLNYELDLWGKLKGKYQSARRSTQALEFAYYTALLSLTTDVANHYFQLRTLDAQMELYQATIENFQTTYNTVNNRYEKGLVNYIDAINSSLQVTNAQANLENLKRQRALQEDAIAVLLGVPASDFCLPSIPLMNSPPAIPAGIPSEILSRRPDIAQAERNMAAEHSLIGVAYAAFFPSLTLTDALGFISPIFKEFLHSSSRYWAFGASANQPIFNGGRDIYNLEATQAAYREAEAAYKQSVIVAFQEVEDALQNLEKQYSQSTYLAASVQTAEKSFSLAISRYKSGLSSYLEVMEGQRSQLTAQTSFVELQGLRFLSTVQLIKALGGAWSDCFSQIGAH